MTIITEGTLQFEFASGWNAIKFDETQWHKKRSGYGIKAMDILVQNGNRHWWIEIKDCEGYEGDNKPRLSESEPDEVIQTKEWIKEKKWEKIVSVRRKKPFIIEEVIEKFQSTLVSLHIAKYANETDLSQFFFLCDDTESLKVILLLTWDAHEVKRLAQKLQQRLNTALQPYGLQGFVVNEQNISACGITSCTITRI